MPGERDNDGKSPDWRTGAGWGTPTRLFMRIAGLPDVVGAPVPRTRSRARRSSLTSGGLPVGGKASRVRPVPRTLGSGRRLGTALVLLSAALALLAGASDGRSAQAVAAANSVTFQDSSGEDAAGPDITSLTVANDDQGNVTFTLNIPNRPTLTADMEIDLVIDSDANPATGAANTGGAEYILVLAGPLEGRAEAGLFRWDGTNFTSAGVSQSTLIFSYANGATLRINASELGGTRRFGVRALAATGVVLSPDGTPDYANSRTDSAPDRGVHTYDVKITPPSLVLRNGGSRPTRPAAGKAFAQFVSVARSDGAPLQDGTATCRVTVGGARVVARASAVTAGRASCTFKVPRTAQRKTSRVTVTVSSGGLTATKSFSARVA